MERERERQEAYLEQFRKEQGAQTQNLSAQVRDLENQKKRLMSERQ